MAPSTSGWKGRESSNFYNFCTIVRHFLFFILTPIEMQFSSPPDGNLTTNLDPAFSSESLSGRNLQTTLILSSAAISRSRGVDSIMCDKMSLEHNVTQRHSMKRMLTRRRFLRLLGSNVTTVEFRISERANEITASSRPTVRRDHGPYNLYQDGHGRRSPRVRAKLKREGA